MTLPPSVPVAPISRRAIAYVIDACIASAIAIVLVGALLVAASLAGAEGMLQVLVVGGPVVLLLLLIWFFVYTLMQSRGGSIGMRAQGLRLVAERDQRPLGFGRALLRNIIFWLACSIVVGYVTPLFDSSGRFQGWHDKVAGSLMLSARGAGTATVVPDAGAQATPAASAAARPAGAPVAFAAGDPRPAPVQEPRGASTGSIGVAGASGPPAAAPAQPTAAPAPRPAPAAAGDGLIAFVPGITADAPPPRAAPVREPQPESDLDATVIGLRAGQPVGAAARPAPATAPAPAAAPAPGEPSDLEDTRISIPGHRLVFTWDDGTRVSVSRRTIFGRNPAPEDGAVAVPVRDETLSLSKTHFEAAAESAGGWVLDRHSTNGTTLIRDGQRIACPAGQRVPVRLGDAIEIGDRIVTIGGYA